MLLKPFSEGSLGCTPLQTHAQEHLRIAVAESRHARPRTVCNAETFCMRYVIQISASSSVISSTTIKSEVSTFPIVLIFFRGCVTEIVCYIIFCHLLYIHYGENQEIFFISIVQFMMSANSRIRFVLQIVFVCLYITLSHYHHCANFIWRHWTYRMAVRYNLSSVWVRLDIFSQLSIKQYVGLCVFSLPISFVMIEIIYILCLTIIIKSEVWTITHCLGLGHETMVCAVCLSILLSGIRYD